MSEQQRLRKVERFFKAEVGPQAFLTTTEEEGSALCNVLAQLGIPQHMKATISSRVQSLVAEESSIVAAPGDQTAWMVRSLSGQRPHYVREAKSGGYLCDDQCLAYKSAKICSHTLAVAMKCHHVPALVRWCQTSKTKPNFTSLAESGKPLTAGKTKRKAASKKATSYVVILSVMLMKVTTHSVLLQMIHQKV